jgi:uncharacterized protein YjlB
VIEGEPMNLREMVKQKLERATGWQRPHADTIAAALRRRTPPRTIRFADDGTIPNNPTLPMIVYPAVVDLARFPDPAAVFEALFEHNGWGDSWRDGIYDYAHYHSGIHEVLGIARGHARVRFGGDRGREILLAAGDVAILPAGTGHQRLTASGDFLVVGAYPPDGTYDECTGWADEHAEALKSIPQVPIPERDPVFGREGALTAAWRR